MIAALLPHLLGKRVNVRVRPESLQCGVDARQTVERSILRFYVMPEAQGRPQAS